MEEIWAPATIWTYFRYHERLNQISNIVEKIASKDCVVLDVACAQGNFALLLAEKGYRVIALDLKQEFLKYSKLKYEKGWLSWLKGDAEKLPLNDSSIDLVLCGELMEHVAYPEKVLSEIRRVLKNEGYVIITTPNQQYLDSDLMSFNRAIKNGRDRLIQNQFKPDADGHLFAFSMEELSGLLESNNFICSRKIYLNSPIVMTNKLLRLFIALGENNVFLINHMITKIPFFNRFLCCGLCVVGQKMKS